MTICPILTLAVTSDAEEKLRFIIDEATRFKQAQCLMALCGFWNPSNNACGFSLGLTQDQVKDAVVEAIEATDEERTESDRMY